MQDDVAPQLLLPLDDEDALDAVKLLRQPRGTHQVDGERTLSPQ
jgi:hypothetical protein